MAQSIAEKIIARHVGHPVTPGEVVVARVDGAMATDATAPLAIEAFRAMGGRSLWRADRFALVIDHAAPAPNEQVANLHRMMRDFARETGCALYDVGEGICHQLMVEHGHVRPGDLFVGADSHTPTCGALDALAIGVGSTDLAGVMCTGKTWLKVPASIRAELSGRLAPGVSAKDLALFLVGRIGAEGASYQALELGGPAVAGLSLAGRMTLANMAAEMGAKAAVVDPAGLALPEPFAPVLPDPDAAYSRVLHVDVSELRPQVSLPHAPEQVVALDAVLGRRVDLAFIGSCTSSRLEDLHAAAAVLRGRRIAAHVRLLVAPGSRRVLADALRDNTIADLIAAGATLLTPGCGPCVGTHNGIPADGECVISSANRNFRGRMGNPNAEIYLSSPAVVAASALRGAIADPGEVIGG
jgi:3-isopropylmalate/(R)-2-methylmalate dehydratase large subunit